MKNSISPSAPAIAAPSSFASGIACGAGAGALWGLVFLVPQWIGQFSPLQLTIGRYFFYGLITAALIAPHWRGVFAQVSRSQWQRLCWLGLAGNTLYFILLSSAVQLGGIAMTSLVVGLVPVAVAIIGSRDQQAVSLSRLAPSLLLSTAGVICIASHALGDGLTRPLAERFIGLACAIGALLSWSAFTVGNARSLSRLDGLSPQDWNLLMGLVAGAQSIALLPVSLLFENTQHSVDDWSEFALVCAGVAALASILGNNLWNRMSRLLPLTLVGQMILFETLFALLYGLLWEHRLPSWLETTALVFVITSVIACLVVHREPARPRITALEH